MSNAEERRRHAREVRLPRLVRLRETGAPRWMVKNEQISLVLNREGKRPLGPRAEALYRKHVFPLMGR